MKARLKFAAACVMTLGVILLFAGFGQYQLMKHAPMAVCK